MSQRSAVTSSAIWSLPLLNIVFGVGLCMIHAHAEKMDPVTHSEVQYSMAVWRRISSGPLHWSSMDKVLFFSLIVLALEILNFVCNHSGEWINVKHIPVRGKHLDDYSSTDHLFIGISKAQTGPFLYLLLRYCFYEDNVVWTFEEENFSLKTILLPLPILFLVYDFFYTLLHGFLHIKAIYPLIHQHHHVQKAPSRAIDDAVNVHPIEFTLGEYNHLWTIFLCCRVANLRMHVLAPLLFSGIGGVLAGWNHTRFDLTFKLFGVTLYDSKAHDVHHRIPQSNFGQYTIFWDYMFGSYRPYDPTDRVNPKAQLDPKTGKSFNSEYIKERSTY